MVYHVFSAKNRLDQNAWIDLKGFGNVRLGKNRVPDNTAAADPLPPISPPISEVESQGSEECADQQQPTLTKRMQGAYVEVAAKDALRKEKVTWRVAEKRKRDAVNAGVGAKRVATRQGFFETPSARLDS